MTTEGHQLSISGLRVAVVRKRIKNLHLGVYPPDGRVRVAVPLAISDSAVRVAVIGKLRWIRRQRAAFEEQARQSPREMVSGETHYVFGRRRRLEVVETSGAGAIEIRGRSGLRMHAKAVSTPEQRERLMQRWYRARLQELVPPLIEKWQNRIGVEVEAFGIKRMKTKWGSCSIATRRIWLNLELAKKPPECLEYIVVHELVHLVERRHSDRFHTLMDHHLPRWRALRKMLNASPLAHEKWEY